MHLTLSICYSNNLSRRKPSSRSAAKRSPRRLNRTSRKNPSLPNPPNPRRGFRLVEPAFPSLLYTQVENIQACEFRRSVGGMGTERRMQLSAARVTAALFRQCAPLECATFGAWAHTRAAFLPLKHRRCHCGFALVEWRSSQYPWQPCPRTRRPTRISQYHHQRRKLYSRLLRTSGLHLIGTS